MISKMGFQIQSRHAISNNIICFLLEINLYIFKNWRQIFFGGKPKKINNNNWEMKSLKKFFL